MRAVIITILILISAQCVNSAANAQGISLEPIEEKSFGEWKSFLYKNSKSGNLLCAVESEQRGALLRVNHYKRSGDTFLEIRGENWNMMEGDVRFSLEFDVNNERYKMEVRGKSWGTDYTHDILDKRNFHLLMGLLMKSRNVRILNSNNVQLLMFELNGSSDAITDFGQCVSR
jgi:hypothetical protein